MTTARGRRGVGGRRAGVALAVQRVGREGELSLNAVLEGRVHSVGPDGGECLRSCVCVCGGGGVEGGLHVRWMEGVLDMVRVCLCKG